MMARRGLAGLMPKKSRPNAQWTAACIIREDLPVPDCPTISMEPPLHSHRLPRTVFGSSLRSKAMRSSKAMRRAVLDLTTLALLGESGIVVEQDVGVGGRV
jgi:hypothetical protein